MTEEDELKTFAEDFYFKKENFQRKFSKESKRSSNSLAVQLMNNRILRRQRQQAIAAQHTRAQKVAPL